MFLVFLFFFFYLILKEADRLNTAVWKVVVGVGEGGGCSHIKASLLKDPPVTSCL